MGQKIYMLLDDRIIDNNTVILYILLWAPTMSAGFVLEPTREFSKLPLGLSQGD